MLAWKPENSRAATSRGSGCATFPPLRCFCFAHPMFAVASATGLTEIPTTQMKADVTKQIADREATLKRQGTIRAERLKANKSTVPIDNQMAQTRRELDGLKQMKEKGFEGQYHGGFGRSSQVARGRASRMGSRTLSCCSTS